MQHFADGDLLFEPGLSDFEVRMDSGECGDRSRGEPFLIFMREQIFRPLGMNNTGVESATEENPDHVGEPGEGMPLLTRLQREILQPLGIGVTNARFANGKFPDRATFYMPTSSKDPREGRR